MTTGEQRRDALARAAEAVDRLSDAEVARLRQELPREAPVQEPLAMKAARIALHLRDYPRAQEAAREVFLRWPGGPYAAEAKGMVEKIGRLTFVRPDVIGVAVPLSGNYQPWGEAIVRAVQLALGDRPIARIVVRDTRGEPDGAAKAIEALALEEGAIVVVGGVTNAEAERAAATAEELALPFVSLSKQAGVTAAGPHVFQNMLTAPAQARALADLAMGRLGLRRFAIMYPSITYGTELANAFWDEVEARGGEIRGAETYAADRTTFTPLVKDLVGKLDLEARADWGRTQREIAEREKDPFRRRKALEKARDRLAPVTDFEAIFIPDFARNVKLVAPALAVEDVVTQTCLPDEVARISKVTGRPDLRPVQLLGANGWGSDPSLFDVGPGGAGRYVRCAVFVDGFFAGSARPATRAFVDAFASGHAGQVPTILEASAFDAVGMARQQLERRVQTRDGMRDGLAAVKGFPGATGDITMGPDRTPVKELFFLTVDPKLGLRELTQDELAGHRAGGQP
jgi:ABC-type branched-subunit amino acid transport system substrate-binding protein